MTKEISFNLKFRIKINGNNVNGALMAIEGLKKGNDAWVSSIAKDIELCNPDGHINVEVVVKETK